jgi:hypothetical protein
MRGEGPVQTYDHEFYSPFDGLVLFKAEEQGGKWNLYLQASNEGLDQEQEVILCKALKDSQDYYLSHGILSWDHKHKVLHDPGFIIGEPSEVAFSAKNETLVKGWLYQKNDIARKLWKNLESAATKLGSSVGGGILSKAEGTINKVIWDEVAVTNKPVNDGTMGKVQLIPFAEFAKALMAGAGVDSSTFSGGRALTGENLDSVMKDATVGQTDKGKHTKIAYEEQRRYFDSLLGHIKKGSITSMNDVISYTLDQGYEDSVAASLIEFVAKKIPKLR